MAHMGSAPGPTAIQKVVIFIDGGYLRAQVSASYKGYQVDFKQLHYQLLRAASDAYWHPHLLRAYYYDANVDITSPRERSAESEAKYKVINDYLSGIKQEDFYQVRVGRLVSARGRYRQKRVDVQLAIDMVIKAYQSEYDTAVVLAGDDDLTDAVEAVKHIGKSVCGVFFEKHCSDGLRDAFDIKYPIPSRLDPTYFLTKSS